jgi:HEAT repeat protein
MQHQISESLLKTDLNDLAHDLVRELAVSAKKVTIYGAHHPAAGKALARPFVYLSQIFHFRGSLTINLERGCLYVLNIRLKETVFTSQLIEFMQTLDLTSVTFESDMTAEHLAGFVSRLVKRLSPASPDYRMNDFLSRAQLSTITVNTEQAAELFEKQKHYRGDVDGDFSVKRVAIDQLGEDLDKLSLLAQQTPSELLDQGIDFHPPIVVYLVPEKIASLNPDLVRRQLKAWADELRTDRGIETELSMERFIAVVKLLRNHPDRQIIMADIDSDVVGNGRKTRPNELVGETGKIRMQTREHMAGILKNIFSPDADGWDDSGFPDAFERLTRTGQHDQASDTIAHLLDRMTDTNPQFRQRALRLVSIAIDCLDKATHRSILENALELMTVRLSAREETFEYSELLSTIFSKCCEQRRYDLAARLTEAMAQRRQSIDGVTVYDAMAVKKGFENIEHSNWLDRLVDALVAAPQEQLEDVRRTLVALASDRVAVALSEIIAHPIRQVRQHCLRILAALGKSSLRVFSEILMDDLRFERPADRRELADPKWYVIRNSIFVLGTLKDTAGLPALRLRISDTDSRVRREIITALEKIGGEDAVDLLALLAEDAVRENAEAAVIAIGLIGSDEHVPILIDCAGRNPATAVKAVQSVGRLGGDTARSWLLGLLDDEDALLDLAAGRAPKDDLRVAVIRALASIGDRNALEALTRFRDGLSATQKVLFKHSAVQKALSDALS